MPYAIRAAREEDFDIITAIYAEAVEFGTASFELNTIDKVEMLKRRDALVKQGYPYFILEDENGVQGYAYVGPYRARPAYRFVVENSIYLAKTARGKGYGTALLEKLVDVSTELGFRQMVAVIGDSENHGSVAVHKKCGFRMIGTLKDMGWKHGRWLDTVYMQLAMGGEGPADLESVPGRMFEMTKTP